MEMSTSTEVLEERIQTSILYISGWVNLKTTKQSYEVSGEKTEFGHVLYDIFTKCEDTNITEETIMTAWKTLSKKLDDRELNMGSMGDIILNMCQLISETPKEMFLFKLVNHQLYSLHHIFTDRYIEFLQHLFGLSDETNTKMSLAVSFFIRFATKLFGKIKEAFHKSLQIMSDILGNMMGSITDHVKFSIIPGANLIQSFFTSRKSSEDSGVWKRLIAWFELTSTSICGLISCFFIYKIIQFESMEALLEKLEEIKTYVYERLAKLLVTFGFGYLDSFAPALKTVFEMMNFHQMVSFDYYFAESIAGILHFFRSIKSVQTAVSWGGNQRASLPEKMRLLDKKMKDKTIIILNPEVPVVNENDNNDIQPTEITTT